MSMNIAVIGASGNIGTKITQELLSRGHQITGIARNPEKVLTDKSVTAVEGDIMNPAQLAESLRGHDAIICAASFIPNESQRLLEAVKSSGVNRFLMVGGAASLRNADGEKVFSTLDLPEGIMNYIKEGMRALDLLKEEKGLEWTFFSPAVMIGPGERTGQFRLGKDDVVADDKGESNISYDDYAIAMVDELEQGNNIRSRFTIGY